MHEEFVPALWGGVRQSSLRAVRLGRTPRRWCAGSVGCLARDPGAQSMSRGGVAVDRAAAALYCGVLFVMS